MQLTDIFDYADLFRVHSELNAGSQQPSYDGAITDDAGTHVLTSDDGLHYLTVDD